MTPLASSSTIASPWGFHPHPDVWLLVAVLVGGYVAAPRLLGRDPGGAPSPILLRKKVLFFSGVFVLWVAADWPIHDLSEDYLLSVHMVQHLLFSFVAAPLMLAGMPTWLLRKLLGPRKVMRPVRFLTRPLVALLIFNGVIAITHWPALVDASLRSEPVHLGVHTVLLASAVLMWWPVVDPLPELSRLTEPGKMLYLFLQSIVPTVPASFLTFADNTIYRFYESVPRLWGLSPVTDQRIAGLIMKLGGGVLLWSLIAVLFFTWSAKEEKQELHEISWDDFERELQAWDLRK